MKKIFFLCIFLLAAAAAFADGTFNFGVGTGTGDGWTWDSLNGKLTITANGTYTLTGSGPGNRIVVQSGLNVNITLDNARLGSASASAFDMTGATVNLTLVGDNRLFSVTNNAG
jgi:hypothetical protein